jgi:hypothetical protein
MNDHDQAAEHFAPGGDHWRTRLAALRKLSPQVAAMIEADWPKDVARLDALGQLADAICRLASTGQVAPRRQLLKIDPVTGEVSAVLPCVWTSTDFDGHYPVGSAAVVVADTAADASRLLGETLTAIGLPQKGALSVDPLPLKAGTVRVLCDGNY